jgi:hypothetical protein
VNKDTRGRPSTNEDVASKPRHITRTQHSTHGDMRSKPRQITKSASRWHLAQRTMTPRKYEEAPRLRYKLISQASIGFYDNLWKLHAQTDSWNESLNSMPCSFHYHDDRLEFRENVNFMLREPFLNDELRAMQETHATFNYTMPCW